MALNLDLKSIAAANISSLTGGVISLSETESDTKAYFSLPEDKTRKNIIIESLNYLGIKEDGDEKIHRFYDLMREFENHEHKERGLNSAHISVANVIKFNSTALEILVEAGARGFVFDALRGQHSHVSKLGK